MKSNKQLKARQERELKIILCTVIITLISFMILDLIINYKNISKDIYGNTCHGNILKICSGDLHE